VSYTCPQCGKTSHHPDDERNGYCGNCHAYTSLDPRLAIAELFAVPPELLGLVLLQRGGALISDTPLPEGHTARALAAALAEAGAPAAMIRRAERGYYHDYLSPLAMPELALVNELRSAARRAPDEDTARKLIAVAQDVIAGKHDANKAESDEWARTPEGRAAFRELTGHDMPPPRDEEAGQ
jgi:hypothetical protein